MKTYESWICCNCDEVFADASTGRCPACESKSILSLSRIINGKDSPMGLQGDNHFRQKRSTILHTAKSTFGCFFSKA